MSYIKQTAVLSNLKNEKNEKIFDKVSLEYPDTALKVYLNESNMKKQIENNYIPIFPFGCNNSQYRAVQEAMENQMSVILGPPGTGKT